jgi:acyl-CoA synthetase (NDP forming)
MKVSALIEVAPEIVDLDLNPLMVLEPGKGIVVADARIRVQSKADSNDTPHLVEECVQPSFA